jgi:hypothetical protein
LNDLNTDDWQPNNMRSLIVGFLVLVLCVPTVIASTTYSSVEGHAWTNCDGCNYIVRQNNNTIAEGDTLDFQVENGTVEIENASQGIIIIPNVIDPRDTRPTPSESAQSETLFMHTECPCEEATIISSDLPSDDVDVLVFDIDEEWNLEAELIATSNDILIEFYLQSAQMENKSAVEIRTATNSTPGLQHQPVFIESSNSRIIVEITSQSPDTVYSLSFRGHQVSNASHFDVDGQISRIGRSILTLPLLQTEKLMIQSDVAFHFAYFYGDNISGVVEKPAGNSAIWGIPMMDGISIIANTSGRWTMSFSKSLHHDVTIGIDAPNLLPQTNITDNSSWPVLPLDGNTVNAEISLAINDYSDIFRIETTGWPESIHMVQVMIEGNVSSLEVTIWDMNQKTWQPISITNATFQTGGITISSQLGLGTHFLRVEHVDGVDAVTGEWGGDGDEIRYSMRLNYKLIDEGEEPWFAPNENAQIWGERVRWILGLSFLIPALFLVIHIRRDKRFAARMTAMKDRREWLIQCIAEADSNRKSSKDLTRALRTVASMEWEDSIKSWGEPCMRHHTLGIDLAIWRLEDEKTKGDSWPLLVGIKVSEDDWEIAGLRFEAPEGESWLVESVTPRFLHREHEVFIDSLLCGHRLYSQINLAGKANSVDIHLSGIVKGEPMAAKPSKTLERK